MIRGGKERQGGGQDWEPALTDDFGYGYDCTVHACPCPPTLMAIDCYSECHLIIVLYLLCEMADLTAQIPVEIPNTCHHMLKYIPLCSRIDPRLEFDVQSNYPSRGKVSG